MIYPRPYSEFMFISHESDHCQKEKLVVSPAFNQVVQSLYDRLLRLSYSSPHGSINQSSPHLSGPISSSQDRIRGSSYGLCRCPPIHPLQLARRILLHHGRFPRQSAVANVPPKSLRTSGPNLQPPGFSTLPPPCTRATRTA